MRQSPVQYKYPDIRRWLTDNGYDADSCHAKECDYAKGRFFEGDKRCRTCDRVDALRSVSCPIGGQRQCVKCWNAEHSEKWADGLYDCINKICDAAGIGSCRRLFTRDTLWDYLGIGRISGEGDFRNLHLIGRKYLAREIPDTSSNNVAEANLVIQCDKFRQTVKSTPVTDFGDIVIAMLSDNRPSKRKTTETVDLNDDRATKCKTTDAPPSKRAKVD